MALHTSTPTTTPSAPVLRKNDDPDITISGVRVITKETVSLFPNLTYLTIGTGVLEIAPDAFRKHPTLRSVTFATNINKIGNYAFYCCPSLVTFNGLNMVREIGHYAFEFCYALENIYCKNQHTNFLTSIGSYAFEQCSLKTIDLPEGLFIIGAGAFSDCKALRSVSFPTTLKVIEDRAFADCKSLEYVCLNRGLTDIGEQAFFSTGIKEISIPDTVVRIGKSAFSLIPLQTAFIPNSVTILGKGSFETYSARVKGISMPERFKEDVKRWEYMTSSRLEKFCFYPNQQTNHAAANTASSGNWIVPEKQVLPDENAARIEELKKIIDALCKGLGEFESLIRSSIFEHFQKTTGDNEAFCEWLENTLDSVKNFTDELLNANLELVSRSNGRYDESAKVTAWGERYNTLNNWIKHGNGKGSLKERLEIPLHLMLDVQNPGKILENKWESLTRNHELGKDYFEALDKSLSDANDLDWMDVLSSLKMLVALWWLAIHPATTATQMAKAWLLYLRVCKYIHPEVIIAVEYWTKQRISTPNEIEGFFNLLSNECSDSKLIDTLKESRKTKIVEMFNRPDMFYVMGCGELWLGNELAAGMWFQVWEDNRDKQEE